MADRSELLEFLHGGFLLDYYYPLPYGCCFSLHLLPNRIEISLFRTLQPMRNAISYPAFVQMTKFRTDVVQFLFPKVVNFTARFGSLYVNACCSHKFTFW